mmetsp:Transcript_6088/g.10475  ORF Transcript_6088/g.10475 Transcript_6088/m.10475 type:complete len:638 (-) Transcript_6088:15-1928(-)
MEESGEVRRCFCARGRTCDRCGSRLGHFFGIKGFGCRERNHEARCQRRYGQFEDSDGLGPLPSSTQRSDRARNGPRRHQSQQVLQTEQGESLRWLNALFAKMWPKIDEAAQRIVREQVTPQIKESLPGMLANRFRFKKFTLGTVPPTLGPISCFEMASGLKMEVGIDFRSSVDIEIEVGVASVGVRQLTFKGTLIIRLAPLIGEVPVVGGIQAYFLDPPVLEMDLTGLGNVAEMPGLAGITQNAFKTAVAGSLLLPNVISVPVGTEEQGVDHALMSLPVPRGILRFTALEAEDLIGADMHLLSKATSDPYVKVELAGETWQSSTVMKNLNPKWKDTDWHDFVVFDRDQKINIQVFDEDQMSADDLIGKARPMVVSDALDEQEAWIPLFDQAIDFNKPGNKVAVSKNGKARLRFEWMDIASDGCLDHDAVLAEVRIKELQVPAELGSEFSIAVKIGKAERTTPLVKVQPANANAAAAVDKTLAQVVRASDKQGLDTKTIAAITGLAEEEVDKMLQRKSFEPKDPAPAPCKAGESIMVNRVLYIPFGKDALLPGSINVTVFNKKKIGLASGSLALSEVTKLPGNSWPQVDAKSSEKGLHYTNTTLPLKSLKGGRDCQAQVMVTLKGLVLEAPTSSFVGQ